jgi:multisubunit Na+/H+ antiporter MnhF subunit
MEFVATVGTAMLAVLAITSENQAYIDVMLLVALVSFLGTVAIAASIERRIHR